MDYFSLLIISLSLTQCIPHDIIDVRNACLIEQEQGVYLYEKSDACGCDQEACAKSHLCFQGQCCDPSQHLEDLNKCGCRESCDQTELCVFGLCCDPRTEMIPQTVVALKAVKVGKSVSKMKQLKSVKAKKTVNYSVRLNSMLSHAFVTQS